MKKTQMIYQTLGVILIVHFHGNSLRNYKKFSIYTGTPNFQPHLIHTHTHTHTHTHIERAMTYVILDMIGIYIQTYIHIGLPCWLSGKESACQ